MKTLKFRLTFISLLIMLVCMFCAGLVSAFKPEKNFVLAEDAVISSSESGIEDSYIFGSELTIPETVSVEYNGGTYTATASSVQFPDGISYVGLNHKLNQLGTYTIFYTFKADNVTLKARKTISVCQNNWSVSSERSQVKWGSTNISNGVSEGLILSLFEGDTFQYNVPFNLSKTNLTEIININPFWEPTTGNHVEEIVVTLTDAYDPSIQVMINTRYHLNSAGTKTTVYVRAGLNNDLIGCEYRTETGDNTIILDDLIYKVQRNNNYGQSAGTNTFDYSGLSFFYDYETKRIYSQAPTSASVVNYKLVNDLDEFAIAAQDFAGFTTGEVFLSLHCENYYESAAQLAIGKIFGASGEDLKSQEYQDETNPVIEIDTNLTDATGVYAVKGEAVNVFDARAYDINLVGDVKTNVYYNYNTAAQTYVALKNGQFTPNKLGCYTIVYTAIDTFGNTATETVYVNVIESMNGATVNKGIEFNWVDDSVEGKSYEAGKEVALPEYTLFGINQTPTMEITAVSQYGNEIKIDVRSNTFVPSDVGEYTITYHYFDNVYEYEEKYTVSVSVSDAVNFLYSPAMPKYFIKNMEYSFEDYFAYEYKMNGEPTMVATSFELRFDDEDYLAADTSLVKILGEETVQFRYTALGAIYETEKLPIIDVNFGGKLNIFEYFQGDFTVVSNAYVSNVLKGNNTLDFINPISLSTFALEFKIPDTAKYTEVKVILTDYYDREAKIELSLKSEKIMQNNQMAFLVNNASEKSLTGTFASGSLAKGFYYNSANNSFVCNSTANIEHKLAFKTDLCFLSIELIGLNSIDEFNPSERSISFTKVSNQNFSTTGRDTAMPIITADVSNSGYKNLNDVITVSAGVATDAYSSILASAQTVKIFLPSGGYALATDGTRMNGVTNDSSKDYDIKLTSFGTYRVLYEATDASGQTGVLSYYIVVSNNIPPVVSIEGGADENTLVKVKLGKEYVVKSLEYSDDSTAKENIFVAYFIINENYACVSNSNTITFNCKGIYTVYYYVMDADGNSTTVSYKVQVV